MARDYITVSFVVGSNKHAIQNKEKLKKINNHNHRNFKKSYNEDLDLSRSKDNIILVGSKDIAKDIEKLYKEEFDEAVYNYNQKQKRADRKIINYLDKVSEDNKKNVAVEMILQLGDKEDWQNVNLEDKKKMAEVFKKGLEVLESKGLKIGNAVIHLDEASPHCHIVAVPVAKGFKTGMEKQVSAKAVLEKKKLYELRKELDEKLIDEYNKTYDKNLIKREEKGIIDKHLDPMEYKEVKPFLDELVKTVDKNIALAQVKENLSNKDKEIKELKEKINNRDEKILEYKTSVKNNNEDIEKAKEEAEKKEKEKEEAEAILLQKQKALEEARRNAVNIDNLIMEEKRKKQELTEKQQEIERFNKNYKEMEAKFEAEKEEIKKNIDEIIEKKTIEEAKLKEKEKELQELKNNGAKVDEFIRQEKEKTEKISNKEEVLKNLDERIQNLTKDIGERKEKIEKIEAEEQTIIKRENEIKEKRAERVLKAKEELLDEAIEYLEDNSISIYDKDYYFRKVPIFRDNYYDVDDEYDFISDITGYFKGIKSDLINYKENYKEILEDIKNEILKGIRDFVNFVRKEHFKIEEIGEEVVAVSKTKSNEKEADEKKKEENNYEHEY